MYKVRLWVYNIYIYIYIKWLHALGELDSFIEHVNRCTESIQFTYEVSKTEINFLSIKSKLENEKVETDLYTKQTNSHDYMLYNSVYL